MKKIYFFLVVLFSYGSFAQEFIVKGNVIGKNGFRLSKPQIINLNNKTHVYADFYGDYSIKAKIGDTLLFNSSTDYENCYITLKRIIFNQNNINVELLRKEEAKNKYCQSKPQTLLVFVGKLDYVKKIDDPCNDVMNDYCIGQYKIIEKVYGDFNKEIGEQIKFEFYEHGHIDSFRRNKHKFALLFVEKYCNNEYYLAAHRDILPTHNKRWAINYNPNRNWYYENIDSLEYRMTNIKFKNASFKAKRKYTEVVQKGYPEPYYNFKGRKFNPVLGFYVEDYFKLWKSSQKEWKYSN